MMIPEITSVLARQTQMMIEFGELQQQLQAAILGRDWGTVDRLVPIMERLSHELRSLDEQRAEFVALARIEAGLAEDAPFGEIVAKLADEDRRDLTLLFRSLQIAVLRVKSITRGIDSYVRGSLRATNEVLGTVFPDQKGTLYGRRGRRSPADGRAMVLDRHL